MDSRSITAAVDSVTTSNMGLREDSCHYNILIETLRQRVHGLVNVQCKSGPSTVLTEEYLLKRRKVGLLAILLKRWTWGMVSAEKPLRKTGQRKHPFKNSTAGWPGWMVFIEGILS